ncbi:MAG: acyl transferase [Lentisphaerae bacterium RIFOXYB12_FULL_65_16]|nr:MAG: acyl transferase [Lentisphaerae bacterium RIFOXYA12_64_32]OGV92249.1 MAG: acyl transferase [Lentisphaerae bacterium RIFOXYB12_FULL_65_16]
MSAEEQVPTIAFVWRPEEIGPPVTQMAQRTGSRAIFDCSRMDAEALYSLLRRVGPTGHISDIKISAPALMDPSVGQLLKGTGVRNLWVECQPQFAPEDPSSILQRLSALSENCRCFPIIGDVDLLAAIVKDGSGIGRIVLKGCEASGFVSGETTLVLCSAAREMLRASAKPLDILIWGGIWTPEAAAAFLSTGATGIVFESVHWLTDLVAMDDLQRQQLARLRMDSTALVGLDLQVPCRLFNKGNSLAFKELKAIEDSLCAAEITGESRRSFVSQVQARALQPLESHFTPGEAIPLGVEAAFAAAFAERFGAGTETAVKAFMAEIRDLCRSAEMKRDCFLDSPVAREMGTKYPFIQGAMSCITDVPEFALRVADAGGLPTIALGLMDTETRDRKLGRLPEILGGRPYAVNVVSLAENPFRETHLAWIKQQRPRFVWIAGGDISPIKELLECGIGVAYIAPDDALLKLALEAGVRYVVCEGYEAGGHVGQHSTLTLAQVVLDLKRRKPSLFQDCRVILAGGIFNRETAFMAALLGADAIQMGTAYLATQEIVDTGALTALYRRMIVESPPGGTVVSGQSTGLRVRSLRTPRVAAVLSLEREFAAGHQDERSFRAKMEEMAAGSLFIAARGVDRRSGMPLDEQACLERGQFMSGACAGPIRNVQNLESFHRELAEGPLLLHQPFAGSIGRISEPPPGAPPHRGTPSSKVGDGLKQVAPPRDAHGRIAITGMSVLNALGTSPEEVWAASVAMKSGITLVPPSRWDHAYHYDPRPRVPDKTYCKVGAFVDFHVSRNELGIPPQDFRTMTDATRITLWLADRAIRASGILDSGIPRERIGVIISQNSGEAAGTLVSAIIRAHICNLLTAIKRAIPLTPDQVSAVEREVKAGRMAPDDTTLLGRLNCAAAGFICNRYGFMGPSYAVSAACATSLVALYSAMQMIRNGILDAAVVGGSEESLTHLHFLEFSALGALYGMSGRERPAHEASRPFDAERDGMVLGEGGGMIVIERESLARARGAHVHAIVTGMGASNNHLGMVESSSATQEIAIRASFRGLPYGPDAVDLVECHATSTRQGDVEEVRGLKTFFNPSKRTVLTSFKSQIGHTLGASGIINLIRGIMATKMGGFPATLNYEHPDPEMGLEGSGLFIATEPLDWPCRTGQPRRLQVNAFGFGGSNYVVQMEQALDEVDTILVSPGGEARLAGETGDGPPTLQGVSVFRTEMGGRNCRMAVVAPSDEEALAAIERSAAFAEADIVSPRAVRSLAQQGIFIGPEDLPVPPLALVFPGQGAHYQGMGRVLYESFPVIKEWMDRAAAVADFDLLQLLFHDREENLQKTRWQQPALFTLEHAMARHLMSLGIQPKAMAGHSLGELSALCLAGVYSLEDGFRIVNMRARCMDKAAAGRSDPGVMAAVDAPLDLLMELLQGQADVHIGNINSPKQVILSGDTEAVKRLGARLKERGYRFTLLRVSMAFHSPAMRVIHDELDAYVATLPFHAPQIPVISNTTMAPYPSDPVEIRRILMAHLGSTVHWMNNAQTLWNDYGIRLFVEVGPGEILSHLIADTLSESACIQTCIPPAEGAIYTTALAQLFVQGHLKVRGEPRFVSRAGFGKAPASPRNAPAGQRPPRPVERPPAIPDGQASPALSEAPVRQDHMEALIQIIMDATGFNRDEIQPDMDLRRDLSIRSSRLPIIMDAAERHFGITIELEDFMQVRTVKDTAQRISAIVAKQEGAGVRPATQAGAPGAARAGSPEPVQDEASLKRLTFDLAPVEPAASAALELGPGESILLLSPGKDDGIAKSAEDVFRRDYGVDTLSMPFMPEHLRPGEEGHDILTAEGAARASERISGLASLVGMVITLPEGGSGRLENVTDVSRLLRGLFPLLKAFLQSPTRKFVVLIHSRKDADTLGRLLTDGLLGLFLSAAQEHPAVQFRTLEIDRDTDMRVALRGALDRGYSVVELLHREGRFFSSLGHVTPSVFKDLPSLNLSPGDVVVMSGGATGISAHLARSLTPFSPRLVFLGRTSLDSGVDSAKPRPAPSSSESSPDESRGREIAQTLAALHASGIEATYHTCDVTDPQAVRAILGEVVSRYGRIDGIIHGAGVIRDGWLGQMSPEDFSLVADVKFLGAWNLFSAAEGAGLRFFVGLSSVAAIQGNPGQANYAAANRMMSALLRYLGRRNGAIRFKALMLPPVEGAGMAENPEVRDLLKRRGVAYIHAHELAGLFCRELFVAPAEDDWVMFMRTLPSVRTARLSDIIRPAPKGELDGGTVAFSTQDFPMIEGISCLDLRRERLEASRTFSRQNDLWIADHRPLKSVAHPLVSAAMVVETFMETARLLYPHLQVRGVRQVRFMEMIPCPPEIPRSSRTSCRRADAGLREVVCEVSLAIQDISPTGSVMDRFSPHCTGQVLLGGGGGNLEEGLQDFPVRPDELRTRSVDHKKVLEWYEDRTGLDGRYRVLEVIDGTGSGVVRGRTTYRETSDFAHLPNARYQYSPYLFEALMQLVGFYMVMTDPSERRPVLPVEIGEMRFLRPCRAGERMTLEARLRAQNKASFAWDARGLDDAGHTVIQVRGLRMQWLPE